jgi:archaeal flagellar protein FlaJ
MALSQRARKTLLDTLTVLSILPILYIVAASLAPSLGVTAIPSLSVAWQTTVLAATAGLLIACSFLFNTIDWKEMRGSEGPRILHRGRADLILTMVSIAALFTVILMVVFEAAALLVFLGVVSFGQAGAQVATNFVLIQAILLLVYLLALLARQTNPSRYEPRKAARIAALVLTPLAGLTMVAGSVLAFGYGTSALGIGVHQAVYVVTLGVLLEFVAMRIRLSLPSLWSLFSKAMDQARLADEAQQQVVRRRAVRIYVAASLFVALSMGLVGVLATGTLGFQDPGIAWAVLLFYALAGLVLLGLVVVRLLQHRAVDRPVPEGDELARLVGQKRRDPQEIFRIAVYVTTGTLAFVAAVLCVLTAIDEMPWHRKFATDLFILAFMLGAGPFGIFYNRERKRIAAIDEKFPDFLRDLAESNRAGMTLPRALVTAAGGTYGALTPEIKIMAAQVEWGVAFGDALQRFAKRCKTPLIDRTVALVVEAQTAGGSMVEILTAASEDAREIKQIVAERSQQMSMYTIVVYVAYFVFIAVVLVLALQFIPAFKEAVDATGGKGAKVGGIDIKPFDPEDFFAIFFQAAVVQAIGGGLVGGVLTKGNPVAGFSNIAIMLLSAWLAFRVGVYFATGGAA